MVRLIGDTDILSCCDLTGSFLLHINVVIRMIDYLLILLKYLFLQADGIHSLSFVVGLHLTSLATICSLQSTGLIKSSRSGLSLMVGNPDCNTAPD